MTVIDSYYDNLLSKLSDSLFYAAYFLIIAAGLLSNVRFFSNYKDFAENIANATLVFLFVLRAHKTSYKHMIIQLLILSVLFISFLQSTGTEILKVFFLVIAFQGMDFKKFIRYDLSLKIFLMITVIILYFAGLTDPLYLVRDNGQIRSSMGFAHPNFFGALLFSMCFSVYYLNFKKINFFYYIAFITVTFAIQYFSDSRTSQYSLFLLCLIHVVYKVSSGRILENKIVKCIFTYSFVIVTLISLLTVYLYRIKNLYAIALNEMVTGRIELMDAFLETYKVTLFGNKIEMVGSALAAETGVRYWFLDNGFILLLLRYGLAPFLIISFLVCVAMRKLFNIKAYAFIIIFFIFFLCGILENHFYNTVLNTFILVFSSFAYTKSRVKANEVCI